MKRVSWSSDSGPQMKLSGCLVFQSGVCPGAPALLLSCCLVLLRSKPKNAINVPVDVNLLVFHGNPEFCSERKLTMELMERGTRSSVDL